MEFASLYYAAMHDENGTPRAHRQSVAYGTAAALLTELLITGHIKFGGGDLAIFDQPDPPDRLARHTFDTLCLSPPQPLKQWIRQLSYTAPLMTATRLMYQDLVYMPGGDPYVKIGDRIPEVFVPADPAQFTRTYQQVAYVIRTPDAGEPWHITWLTGIALATGIGARMLPTPEEAVTAAARVHLGIPYEVRDLIQATAECCAESNRRPG